MKNFYAIGTIVVILIIYVGSSVILNSSTNEETTIVSENDSKVAVTLKGESNISTVFVASEQAERVSAKSPNLHRTPRTINKDADYEGFSQVVYDVRDKIFSGVQPETEEVVAAMREIYADRPKSFKRNLEKFFEISLNPPEYCNTMRRNWAQPFIKEVADGMVFVDDQLWEKNSPGNKVQLGQYFSKCTQDNNALELVSFETGTTIAYYSLSEGYRVNGL